MIASVSLLSLITMKKNFILLICIFCIILIAVFIISKPIEISGGNINFYLIYVENINLEILPSNPILIIGIILFIVSLLAIFIIWLKGRLKGIKSPRTNKNL